MAGSSLQVRHDIAEVIVNDLQRFFRGDAVENRVTTAMLARMT
jgi:hypothetical protein